MHQPMMTVSCIQWSQSSNGFLIDLEQRAPVSPFSQYTSQLKLQRGKLHDNNRHLHWILRSRPSGSTFCNSSPCDATL